MTRTTDHSAREAQALKIRRNIRAARLRVALDKRRGRHTPDEFVTLSKLPFPNVEETETIPDGTPPPTPTSQSFDDLNIVVSESFGRPVRADQVDGFSEALSGIDFPSYLVPVLRYRDSDVLPKSKDAYFPLIRAIRVEGSDPSVVYGSKSQSEQNH